MKAGRTIVCMQCKPQCHTCGGEPDCQNAHDTSHQLRGRGDQAQVASVINDLSSWIKARVAATCYACRAQLGRPAAQACGGYGRPVGGFSLAPTGFLCQQPIGWGRSVLFTASADRLLLPALTALAATAQRAIATRLASSARPAAAGAGAARPA